MGLFRKPLTACLRRLSARLGAYVASLAAASGGGKNKVEQARASPRPPTPDSQLRTRNKRPRALLRRNLLASPAKKDSQKDGLARALLRRSLLASLAKKIFKKTALRRGGARTCAHFFSISL